MSSIRRALVYTTAERYVNLLTNFALVAGISRLLTPEQVGVSALGAMVVAFSETVRDIPTGYLVQQPRLRSGDVRAAYTAMLAISLLIAVGLVLGAGWIASLYQGEHIHAYTYLIAASLLPGPFERPIMSLMRREMEFGRIAQINVATCLVNAATTLGLAAAGYGILSFGWGLLFGSLTTLALAMKNGRDWSWRNYWPSARGWRRVVAFGGFTSATALLGSLYEMLPVLVLSRTQPFHVVGLFNRATLVVQLPDRVLISGLAPVLFPAFAAEARANRPLAPQYVSAISYFTSLQFPAMALVAVLTEPIVRILLGPQWGEVVPIVRLMALASLMVIPTQVTYGVMVAAGAVRPMLLSTLINRPICAVITVIAAMNGLTWLALSLFVTVPINTIVVQIFVRRRIGFAWADLARVCIANLGLGLITCAAPLAMAAANGWDFSYASLSQLLVAIVGSAAGWVIGLKLTRNRLFRDIGDLGAMAWGRLVRYLDARRSAA